MPSMPEEQLTTADQPDRCARCWCDDCGGTLAEHAETGCICKDCFALPEYACTRFVPSGRIGLLAEQLGPLLSAHLGLRQQQRCLAVAHAAHHALLDYDTAKVTREAAAMLRRHCPSHGYLAVEAHFTVCHCPATDEIDRRAAAPPRREESAARTERTAAPTLTATDCQAV